MSSKIAEGLLNDNGKVLIDDISTEVNNFSLRPEKIIDEINGKGLRLRFNTLVSAWIRNQAEAFGKDYFDGRNEYSSGVCAQLNDAGIPDTLDIEEEYLPTVTDAEVYMQRMHRTLQQSFSGVVFRYLSRGLSEGTLPEETADILNGLLESRQLDKYWDECPLI